MTQTGTQPACAPVLLIEDEPAVMEFVRSALERNGYSVVLHRVGCSSSSNASDRRLPWRGV